MNIPSTDNVTVALHDFGGEGAPLLVVHATGFHGRAYGPLIEELDGYRTWAPDLRAHGDASPPLNRRFHMSGFTEDLLAVLDSMGVDSVFGFGHSMGGAVLLLAEQARPGTFVALYVYEPIVLPPLAAGSSQGKSALAEAASRRREVFDSYQAAYDNYAAKPPLSDFHPDALRAYVDHGFAAQPDGTVMLKCRAADEAAVFGTSSAHEAFAGLDKVHCPVTVARGKVDPRGVAQFADLVVDRLPEGRLAPFDALGHLGPMQDPAAVAKGARTAFAGVS